MKTLLKYAPEKRRYTFDFTLQEEILAGEILTSATITQERISGTGTLTIGTPTVTDKTISAFVEGGEELDVFHLKCLGVTGAGSKPFICARLKILEC
jgi:hypothetical protein